MNLPAYNVLCHDVYNQQVHCNVNHSACVFLANVRPLVALLNAKEH